MVQPLLELLRRYTGFHLVLIAGVPLKEGPRSTDIQMYVYILFTMLLSNKQAHSGSRPVAQWARHLRNGASASLLSSQIPSSALSRGI